MSPYFNAYVVFELMSIKVVHLYIIQYFQNFRATGNGYRNMQIVILEREYLIVVCV
jgi:hypothetical protein